MKKKSSLLFVMLIFLFTCAAQAVDEDVHRLTQAEMAEAVARRQQTITTIQNILQKNKDQCTTFVQATKLWKTEDGQTTVRELETAIILAGKIRSSELAQNLMDFIEFASPEKVINNSRLQTSSEVFPAVNVLISIGLPALDEIIRQMCEKDLSDTAIRNFATILAKVSCPQCLRYRVKQHERSGREKQVEEILSKVDRLCPVKLNENINNHQFFPENKK